MKKLNIIINFLELKYRIIYFVFSFIGTFSTCFYFKVELFYLISNFFLRYENGFIYTGLLDPLLIYIKLTFFSSLIFGVPLIIYFYGFYFFDDPGHYFLCRLSTLGITRNCSAPRRNHLKPTPAVDFCPVPMRPVYRQSLVGAGSYTSVYQLGYYWPESK